MKQLVIFSIGLMVTAAVLCQPQTTKADGISISTEAGWQLNVTGAIPVFMVMSQHDDYSSNDEDQFATRFMSGFNPGSINFSLAAPEMNGISVSGIFQINHHLQGAGIQNDGLFEGRVADIVVSGDFGTINAGKGFGIFNSSSIADMGSALGVGRFGGPDAANATLGRIGSGYSYANFNPRVTYTTPDLNGLIFKVGLINPEKPDGLSREIETNLPRFEAQADYIYDFNSGTAQVWAGGMHQNVDVNAVDFDYNFTGWDTGVRINAAGLQVTGAYSETQSVGADGLIGINLVFDGIAQAEVNASQWYMEGAYTTDNFTIGGSYGEGSQDANETTLGASPDITNELFMAFMRYNLTDNATLMAEFQDFSSDAQSDYNAFVLGMQFTF